jgi:hypothetical protein
MDLAELLFEGGNNYGPIGKCGVFSHISCVKKERSGRVCCSPDVNECDYRQIEFLQ